MAIYYDNRTTLQPYVYDGNTGKHIPVEVKEESFDTLGGFEATLTVKNPIDYWRLFHNDIKKIIFNPPATIVYWYDGDKTVVKCRKDEIFDWEKGLAMAISKHYLGCSFKKEFKEGQKVWDEWKEKEEKE